MTALPAGGPALPQRRNLVTEIPGPASRALMERRNALGAARERLAQVDDDSDAPNRLPPEVDDAAAMDKAGKGDDVIPTAAE